MPARGWPGHCRSSGESDSMVEHVFSHDVCKVLGAMRRILRTGTATPAPLDGVCFLARLFGPPIGSH
eukprot:15437594-Alexandrium_andersonii.AAC.1